MNTRKNYTGIFGGVLAGLLAVACAQDKEAPTANEETVVTDLERAQAAIANSTRLAEDGADDEMRKPSEVLAFIGIEPGMAVFEIEAGRGYYTELFSQLVGADGTVIMQNPESFDSFLGDAVDVRLADNRLPNVQLSKTNFDNLEAESASIDVATWLLGPHELYFTPSDGASLGEVGPTYAEIFRILKPGGRFVVLDHVAAPGAPETTGDTLHRIDPGIVKSLAEAAGFELVEESNILQNGNDDYEMQVFDPVVRRKTDRFLLKYEKPAE